MQYQVPHFLETEQRIWGPFTFTNFVILIAIGGVLSILYFLNINFALWLVLSFLVVVATLAFMFGRYNGRNLSRVSIDFVRHIFGERRHTWRGIEVSESVSDFVLTKKELRSLPNIGATEHREEKPKSERIKEISKLLDEQ